MRIESKAEKCLVGIGHALANSQLEADCYAVRIRVKTEGRLKEKVLRKQRAKPGYDLESITDVIGIRLITLFRSDLPAVLDKVLDLISHEIQLNPHPLKKDSVEELIVYSTELETSPFNLGIKARLEQRGLDFDIRHSAEGYSSLHVVCRIAPQMVECRSIGEAYLLPVEIQIRTVFEDAWGEIDHRYGYLARSGKDRAAAGSQPLTAPHLRVLKEFTDACASYADTIKQMASPQSALPSGAGKILSVESDGDVLLRFDQLKVPAPYVDGYKKGRLIRDASAGGDDSPAGSTSKYLKAHEYFEDVHKLAMEDDALKGEGRPLYLYYIALNSAFCLLSAGTPNSVERAMSIYNVLVQDYPNYPIVRMRLAQALAKAGKREDSLLLLEGALQMVEEMAAESRAIGVWRDNLPRVDYDHISVKLPKLLGYAYWEKATFRFSTSSEAERLHLYRKAYETTFSALAFEPGDIGLINNLVFYAIEYLSREGSDAFARVLIDALPAYSITLESVAAVEPGASDIRLLDTLLQLYVYQDRIEVAQPLARTLGRRLKSGAEPDEAIAHEMSLRVIEVLSSELLARH